jgi:GLPGLI family protein
MKQKLLSFFVLFLVTMSYGQTTRYIYETAVNPDSINLVGMKIERTFLDVKGNRSLFISEHKLIRDSLFTALKMTDNRKEQKDFSKGEGKKHFEPTFFEYFIVKNIPEQKTFYYDRVAGKQIYYQEDRPLKWEISNTNEKQNGYVTQKAVVDFGGRVWTAWFAKDIPVSDGPYKFSGLPGLIVKLEDDKGDYKFDLAKKIVINNAFEEPMASDAKQSTRINFHGDKAALDLEFNKKRTTVGTSGEVGNMNFEGGGKHAGGMRGGGHSGGGMHRGMGGSGFTSHNSTEGRSTSIQGAMGENPIELK